MKSKIARDALTRVTVTCEPEGEDPVTALLERWFATTPSTYHDLKTGRSQISVFVDGTCDMPPTKEDSGRGKARRSHPLKPKSAPSTARLIKRSLQGLRGGLEDLKSLGLQLGEVRLTVAPVPKEDWSESWKKHFKPFVVGRRLLVKPSWSLRKPGPGQAQIILDPGLSFGTGQHATTHFCLEQLVEHRNQARSQSFLDLGTGTGILAIAAARLGYEPVTAIDFDPACVATAKENARLNGLAESISVHRRDVARLSRKPARTCALVCANLIDDLLIARRNQIGAQVGRGGVLIVAGILNRQFASVRAALEDVGMVFKLEKPDGEWTSGAFSKP